MSSSDTSATAFDKTLDSMAFIVLLVGVEQCVAAYFHGPYSDWRVGLLLVVLGPLFYSVTGGWVRIGTILSANLQRFLQIDEIRTRLDEQQTRLNDVFTEIKLIESAVPPRAPLQPTVEMLEAGRKAAQATRERRIEDWRAMVSDAHTALTTHRMSPETLALVGLTPVGILEADPRFLSLRRRLSDRTRGILWPSTIGPEGRVITIPLTTDASTMHSVLRYVLDDIDELAKHWGID